MSATDDRSVVDRSRESVPCLAVILERLGWLVFNNRRRRKRLEFHLDEEQKKNKPTTALETQLEELKDELARLEDLLNDCAEWIRVRTGIARDKLVEVGTSTAFTDGKDRDDIYAKLGTLDERGQTAELWADLLSQHPDMVESVKLLPSLESSLPTSAADEHRGEPADEQRALTETLARIDLYLTQPVTPLAPAPAIPQELTTRLGAIESAIESLKPLLQSEFAASPADEIAMISPTQRSTEVLSESGNTNESTNDEPAYSFKVQTQFVWVRGFGEVVPLERSAGVDRLVAIVTSRQRRVSIWELAKIGAEQDQPEGEQVDVDAEGIAERESLDDDTDEFLLGSDADSSVRLAASRAIGDLIARKKDAEERGDSQETTLLKDQIDAALEPAKKAHKYAVATVRNSLNRTYQRLRKAEGKQLAAHFERSVKRRLKEPDFIYDPDERGSKIDWKLL